MMFNTILFFSIRDLNVAEYASWGITMAMAMISGMMFGLTYNAFFRFTSQYGTPFALGRNAIFSSIRESGTLFLDSYSVRSYVYIIILIQISGKLVLSDDSGIEIDFLDKKPGVNSSSFLGGNAFYKERSKKILEMMKDVKEENRTARYVSVIALASPNGDRLTTRATIKILRICILEFLSINAGFKRAII